MEADVAGATTEIQHLGLCLIVHESGQSQQVGALRMGSAAQIGRGSRPELMAHYGLVRPAVRHCSVLRLKGFIDRSERIS
jgi:hypothetical protein